MRIGFDGKRAVRNLTGLGNYSRLVIESLAEENPGDSFYVYTPDLRENPRLDTIKSLVNVEFRLPPPQGFSGSLWRSFGITNNLGPDKIDLYHGLSNELPLNIRKSGIPSVVTIHDVIYRRLPYCYKAVDRLVYDFKYGRACRNADRIIAVSQRTKDDIVELYGISPDKIDVVYQGCDPSFRQKWSDNRLQALRSKYGLPGKFILQVGTIERRKNLELTVRALSALPSDIHLVAVGKDHYNYLPFVRKIAEETGVADRLHFLSGLPFSDLPGLNQLADAVAYPSHYEGFGIPILEALESETPVVAATGSCLEEAGGPKSLYVNPGSPEEMAEALNAIFSGCADTAAMKAEGKRHASRFNRADMVDAIMETYRKTLLAATSPKPDAGN